MENKQLITIEQINPASVFVDGEWRGLVEEIENASDIVADVNTKKGRDAIRSNAFAIARSKTLLDNVGKDLADIERAKIKERLSKIQSVRGIVKDELEALKDERRLPLTIYENEEKEKVFEIQRKIDEENERIQAEKDETERLEKEKLIAEKEAAEAELERMKIEAKIKDELEEKTRQEKAEAQRREIKAKEAIEKAEREKSEAVAQAKSDAEKAVEDERQRVADEVEEQRKEDEFRMADIQHQKLINNEVLESIQDITFGNDITVGHLLSREQIKVIIAAVIRGNVKHVSVNY